MAADIGIREQIIVLPEGAGSQSLGAPVGVLTRGGGHAMHHYGKRVLVAEVQNGLGWLGSQNPAGNVVWHYDIHPVTLSQTPLTGSPSFSQMEARFRDPAMAKRGYGSGLANVRKYAEDIRTQLNTDWADVSFFTKYPVGHFAYASIGGPRQVMHYQNDGWGPDNIDRVFAHETGHIFGAPDEYASSGCNCGGSWGHYSKPNGKCANCAPGGGVACLMKANTWNMCSFTPYHLGLPMESESPASLAPIYDLLLQG